MNKFNLFRILSSLGIFGLSIDGGDSGGGENPGTPPTDITPGADNRDIDIKDDDLKDNDESKTKDLEEKLKNLEEIVSKDVQQKAVDNAVKSIKTDYPSFDETKIIDKLKEIQKVDPAKAASLNNPAGWELLHLKFFEPRAVDNDDFDAGRNNRNEPFNYDEALVKAKTGDTKALSALYENSISTSSKRN